MTTYRHSALASAIVRMWRGWTVIVPVVIVNAVLQALLVRPDATPLIDASAIVYAVISATVFLVAYGLVGACALRVSDGRVGWRTAMGILLPNALRYALWALGLLLAFSAALALADALALLLLGLTPFLLLAVLDGQRNPLAANLRTIGRRFWRWLATALIVGSVVVLGTVVFGVTAFFVRGSAASLLVWLVAGLALAWFTTAWALIYCNANAGEDASEPAADPALEPEPS